MLPSIVRERSAGCIAFKLSKEGPLFALILDRFGRWTFPKGHIEAGEKPFAAARRELQEEVGLSDVELVTRLGETRHSFLKEGEKIEKRVEWFLVKAETKTELRPSKAEHVAEAKWLDFPAALTRLGYANLRPMLALARKVVAGIYIGHFW